MLVIRTGSQSAFQFILKVLDGDEVMFFQTKMGRPFLNGLGFVYVKKQEKDQHKLLTLKNSSMGHSPDKTYIKVSIRGIHIFLQNLP